MPQGLKKTETVVKLKNEWDANPQIRKPLIYSLLGHRMKFSTIATLIGRSVEEIRAAYKGESYVAYVAPDFDTPMELVDSNTMQRPNDCGYSDKYTGQIAPTCAGGGGCKKCWAVFNLMHGVAEGAVSPKVLEVSPIKGIYSLSFDEILQKYREFIGWQNATLPAPEQGPNDPDYLNGIIISDIHAPFHDEEKFAKMIAQTRGTVDVCILAGDGPDFHNYSRFIKYGQHFSIQEEHKSFMAVLATLAESYPEVLMLPGNHDERARKKYAQLLPPDLYQAVLDFHGPNAFDFAELMTKQFENIIIPTTPTHGFAEYRFLYQLNDIVIGHPELFSKISCKSVTTFIDWLKKKAQPMGLVGDFNHVVMGHTHQSGKVLADFGVVGIENACLCLTPDYDSNPKLGGCLRPTECGYTRFRTNRLTGITDKNDINLVYL